MLLKCLKAFIDLLAYVHKIPLRLLKALCEARFESKIQNPLKAFDFIYFR